MIDKNLFKFRSQFVDPFVARLAKSLADDPAFVSEVGLNEFKLDERILGLENILGFILAMYKTAKQI